MQNLSPAKISLAFQNALRSGLIRKEDSAVIFYDLSFLKERLSLLKSCFPTGTLHGLAIKACPLAAVMQIAREEGCGVEAASLGEVQVSLSLGFKPGMIVYDSPVKTMEELEFALRKGIHVNLDNFSELNRVKDLLKNKVPGSTSTIGIRINPQVGEGSISESSVAGEYSKFGVPLRHKRQELVNAFLENSFLSGMHLHVGSQGCSLELLTEGTGRLYDLALEVNELSLREKGYPQITTFDIGGGLPVSYFRETVPVRMEDYVAALKQRAPLLFGNQGIKLITEFGRWTYTNAGWTVSRIEYVKEDPGVNTAMIHVGADLFIRECLNPKDWSHEYTVLDSEGNVRSGSAANPWNLAGPLCFSGDILAKGVNLPPAGEGDHIVIHDTGGYTFSMWSRYNSRFAPRIIGYYNNGESFVLLKEREGINDIIKFWT